MGYAILFALGEAQYSGKNLRVTIFNTFLSRGKLTITNLQLIIVRSK
jgi:hypothetical protein